MRLLDARWTETGNEMYVGCDCGHAFWYSLKKWKVRCPKCNVSVSIDQVREQPVEADNWPQNEKPVFSVYCDGSSTGRADKPGGYGWVILKDGKPVHAGYGGSPKTTNNVMELTAAVKGLEALLASELYKGEAVEVVSDSQYTLGIADGTYSPQKNVELAQKLKELVEKTKAKTRWVRGHSGQEWQERCDSLAKRGKNEVSDAKGTH